MSQQLGRVVSEILSRYFGDIVQNVGNDLFVYGSKPVAMIGKTTGLTRTQIVESLRTLLKFDLASFEPSKNELVADYKLNTENILYFIRYPRYLVLIKSRFGSEAEILVEEVLQQGCCTATHLLVSTAAKYKDDKEKSVSIISLRDTFISLATAGYLQQAPVAELAEGSEVPTLVPVATIVPEIDMRVLVQALAGGNLANVNDHVYWKANFERFHQDFRDDLMIKAITRRIDDNAGELMRILLEQMYLSSPPHAAHSNPFPAIVLRERVQRTDHPLLQQHFDHYLKVLEENGEGFVRRCDDSGGGQWSVRAQHAATALAGTVMLHAAAERLGSNAARILRLVQAKKYISEEDIQKHAMLPNKECKELTYRLLEEHFISVQPMRKAASSGGMAKAIYLYHINFHEVAHTVQEMCYRSLHNILKRSAHESRVHARLRDKQRRVRSLVHGMRLRGEPQANIDDVEETLTPPEVATLQAIDKRLKQLSTAEIELDRTLFVLKWYFMYPYSN